MRRLLLRAYPAAWRQRYGEELDVLLTETGTPPGVIVDVLRAASRARVAAFGTAMKGGEPMRIGPLARHPLALAWLALALMAPTFVLVVGSILGHELGISAVASVVDPIIVSVTAPTIVEVALLAAPAISLALAILPVLEIGTRGADGRGTSIATISLSLRVANIAVTGIALLLGLALAGHHITESVLEAAR